MKLSVILFLVFAIVALLSSSTEAGKIPVKAIQKAGRAIGKGLRAINVASTVHDIAKAFQPKHKKKKH